MSLNEKYIAQTALPQFGEKGQERLFKSRAVIIGIGGLGCPAALHLAASGIKELVLVDYDLVELTNLPRQPLFAESDIGKSKAEVAEQRLSEQFNDTCFQAFKGSFKEFVASEDLSAFDVLLDCTDDDATRYEINDCCVKADVPFVYGGIHQFEGQISVFNYKGGPTYRCLFPEERSNTSASCSTTGVIGTLPGIIGNWQANEAIKLLANVGEVCSGNLIILNLLNNTMEQVSFIRRVDTIRHASESSSVPTIDASTLNTQLLQNRSAFQLIDIREVHEAPDSSSLVDDHIPMNELIEQLEVLDKERKVVLICQKGNRSKALVGRIKLKNPELQLFSLEQGLVQLLERNNNYSNHEA